MEKIELTTEEIAFCERMADMLTPYLQDIYKKAIREIVRDAGLIIDDNTIDSILAGLIDVDEDEIITDDY